MYTLGFMIEGRREQRVRGGMFDVEPRYGFDGDGDHDSNVLTNRLWGMRICSQRKVVRREGCPRVQPSSQLSERRRLGSSASSSICERRCSAKTSDDSTTCDRTILNSKKDSSK
jgi:hypothetical protein